MTKEKEKEVVESAPVEQEEAMPKLKGEVVKGSVPLSEEHKIYAALAVDLPEKAVERTKGAKTGKGYDTTGYKYQYVVNRFNEVLGMRNWWYTYDVVDVERGKTTKGHPRVAITVVTHITLRIGGEEVTKTLAGGHNSNNYADALKGAITNSFKKTAALFGVGKAAYEVSIDDDNTPVNTNEVGVEPSKSGYTPQGVSYVTPKMAEAIGKMVGFLGWNVEDFKKRNDWESLYKISYQQGSKIIDDLKPLVEKKKAEMAVKEAEPAEPVPTIEYGDGGMSDEEADELLASM